MPDKQNIKVTESGIEYIGYPAEGRGSCIECGQPGLNNAIGLLSKDTWTAEPSQICDRCSYAASYLYEEE